MKNIRNIILAAVTIVALNIAVAQASAQTSAPTVAPQTFRLGERVVDAQGNEYEVVLRPMPKVVQAPVVQHVAPAHVVHTQQPAPIAHAQPAPQAQPNGVGKYVGDTLVTGAGGAAQGAILGAVTGRNVGKEALGMGAGAAGGKVTTDLINGIFKR